MCMLCYVCWRICHITLYSCLVYLNIMRVHLEPASYIFFSKSSSSSKSSMTWLLNQSFRAFCVLNLQLDCFDTLVKSISSQWGSVPQQTPGSPLSAALRSSRGRWGSWWKQWTMWRREQVLGKWAFASWGKITELESGTLSRDRNLAWRRLNICQALTKKLQLHDTVKLLNQ